MELEATDLVIALVETGPPEVHVSRTPSSEDPSSTSTSVV